MVAWVDKISSPNAPDGSPRLNFWDPSLQAARKQWFKVVAICFVAITVLEFGLLSIYFGSYVRQEENVYRITLRIIDLDSQASGQEALLGPAMLAASEKAVRDLPHYHLGYQFEQDLSRFALTGPGLPSNVTSSGIEANQYCRDLVNDQTVFGCLLVHANATSAAQQAFDNGASMYSPLGSMALYYEEARNFYSTNQYLIYHGTDTMNAAANSAAQQFAARQLQQLSAGGGAPNFTALSTSISPPMGQKGFSSSLITQPFAYSLYNIHPFDQLQGTAATTAGQIYLIIFTFFVGLGFKSAFDPIASTCSLLSEVIVRICVPFIGYLWISLNYSLVSLAFLVDFNRKYGHSGFVIYIMMNFISMLGLGYAMEFILLGFGLMIFPFFLLFWVIINVSVAFLDVADEDHFYSYGFGLPVWNAVDASKSIVYGTKNHLSQNFGVNLSWTVVGMIGICCLTVFKRKQGEKRK